MNVSNLLSQEAIASTSGQQPSHHEDQHRYHQYPTRHSASTQNHVDQRFTTPPVQQAYSVETPSLSSHYNISPASPTPKNVAFELLFDGAPNYRARLPMRVQIFPHDTTDSIVTTVKNFYGLYEGAAKGVSFEDQQGTTLIARYENFQNNMVVYVRVIPDYSQIPDSRGQLAYLHGTPQKLSHIAEAPQMLPPQPAQILHYGQPPSRPRSRVSRKLSVSPRLGRGQRSGSIQKVRSRSGAKSRGSSVQRNIDDLNSDAVNGYSSSDGGAGSVTSSRKARSEQLASAEISLDNILEGGRRKRAKFESSELPLFVPPQVPAPNSISSISPQRRFNGHDNPSPFARPTQRTFAYNQPLHSPQSFGNSDQAQIPNLQTGAPYVGASTVQHGHRLRDRTNPPSFTARTSSSNLPRTRGPPILPTPDPTIASCISDEDVALQLMRLGDTSNISHGRTSASTLDDAFSGRADAASSVTSESEESENADQPVLPPHHPLTMQEPTTAILGSVKKQRNHLDDGLPSFDSTEPSGDEVDADYNYDEKKEGVFKSDADDLVNEFGQVTKPKVTRARSVTSGPTKGRIASSHIKPTKAAKPRSTGFTKKTKPSSSLSVGAQAPMSPASISQSRKNSSASTLNFQHQLGVDEEDLSSKPRCQRCRKSKKGCDRQRPCQRCKDAGIGVEGCVSEDEGNGRKGRYGRHMGVPVKKGSEGYVPDNDSQAAGEILTGMSGGQGSPDKSKKRKR